MEYYSVTKNEKNLAIGDDRDGHQGYYAKWNKSETQILYVSIYIWNPKISPHIIYMYVYVCVYLCVCMCVYMYVHIHICMYMYVYPSS